VVSGGSAYLQHVQERLVELDESSERLPLFYYFRSSRTDTSVVTLMTGAVAVCLHARSGVSEDAAPGARVYGEELERSLDRIVVHYIGLFHVDEAPDAFGGALADADARERLDRLVASAGAAARRDVAGDPAEVERFAAFCGRAQAFLDSLADRHLHPRPVLLGA
jgi:hypothetical protein